MPAETSPTARALRTLEILQTRGGATADELAARLGVTERAARRYVGILREAGIPVDSIRGPHGGFRLGRGTRLPPVAFTEPEALALVMAVLDGQRGRGRRRRHRRRRPGQGDPRAAPGRRAAGNGAARARLGGAGPRLDPTGPGHHQRPGLGGRGRATRGRQLPQPSPATEWETEVDPWAVVVRLGRWYLLCFSHHADAVRTYRIDRVRDVRPTERDVRATR